jgi:hypothetical protein
MEDEKRDHGAAGTGSPEVDLACGTISPGNTSQALDRQEADPLLAVLLRAACLFDLVEAAVLTPLEAFGRLEHAVHAVSPCACEREILDAFAQHDRERARRKSWPTPEQQHDLPPNWATMPFDALWRHLNNPGRWRPSKHRNRNQ